MQNISLTYFKGLFLFNLTEKHLAYYDRLLFN